MVIAARLPPHDRSGRAFWWASTSAVLVLAANKELDLHSWVLSRGREVFASYGWLEYRTDAILVLACLTVVAATAVAVPLIAAGAASRFPFTTTGIALLFAYILVRLVGLSDFASGVLVEPQLPISLEYIGVVALLLGLVQQRSWLTRRGAGSTGPSRA